MDMGEAQPETGFQRRVTTYWHLTTWNDIEVGRVYGTSWERSNYWDVSDDYRQASFMADELRVSARDLFSGFGRSTAEADEYADRLGAQKAEVQSRKELEFERVRRTEFSDLPSRSSSIFLCESEDQLRAYIEQFKFPVENRSIIELEVVALDLSPEEERDWARGFGRRVKDLSELRKNRRHRANPKFLNCNSHPSSFEENARRYWRGERTSISDLTEVLLRGLFRPLQIRRP